MGNAKKSLNKKDSITVAIPAYNEEKNIKNVIEDTYTFLKKLKRDFEILIINDGSTDKTGYIIENLGKEYPHLNIYHHKKNKGFAGSIEACYRKATKDLVFLIPADGQVKVNEITKFLDLIEDADIVVGYRLKRPESIKRKLLSKVYHFIQHNLIGIKVRETTTANMARKKVVDLIKIESKSAFILTEMIYKIQKKGFIVKEVGVNYYPREAGKPKGDNPLVIIKTVLSLINFYLKQKLNF